MPTRTRKWKSVRWTLGIAIATATLGAKAQTDASLYGVVDFSYGRFEPSGLYREHRFNSNSLTASFVGVNLKHGFEGNWTLGITLETFLRFQDMQTGRRDSDPLLSRNAFVSLVSDYGTLRTGRLQTLMFDTTARFNALGNSVVFSPAMRHLFTAGGIDGVQGDFYWDRAIGYTSPNMEGVTVNAMYARGGSDERGNYSAASVVWSRGLLGMVLSAQNVRFDNGVDDPTKESSWQIGANYNFGLVKAFALYSQTHDTGQHVRSRLPTIGVSVPLGPGTVVGQIGVTTAKGPAIDRRHTSTTIGYLYPYNSLVDIYVLAMDDRVRAQTRGVSAAVGVRWRF